MEAVRLARLSLLFVLLSLAPSLPAHNPSSQPGNTPGQVNGQSLQTAPPSFKSSSNLVLVDVVVTRNGGPVKGLHQSAFHNLPSTSGAIGSYGTSIPSGTNGQFARQVAAEHGTMRQVAEQSGGIAFYESNGFNKALASAFEDSASYYTLAYSPENKQLDGRFRKIEVKLLGANNKKDTTTEKYALSYRRGYFADPPQTKPTKATAWAAGSSMVHNAPGSARLFFRAKVALAIAGLAQDGQSNEVPDGSLTQKLQGPLQRYSIDFLADMHRVNAGMAEDGLHYSTLEFIVIAYDENGKILNYSDRSFKRKMDSAKYSEALQNGWPMHQDLDLPVGDIYLRLGVRDTTTGWLGSLEIPLKVM